MRFRCLLSGHLFTRRLVADRVEVRVGTTAMQVPLVPRRTVRLCERCGQPERTPEERVEVGVGFVEG